jgi:hypothetical protein
MKNKLIIGLLLLAGLITWHSYSPRVVADHPREPHAVIILGYNATLGPIVHTSNGGYRPQTGLEVEWVSRSQNAPEINVGSNLAESMAYLMNAGFRLEQPVNYGQHLFTR